jgi:hypothetical protein
MVKPYMRMEDCGGAKLSNLWQRKEKQMEKETAVPLSPSKHSPTKQRSPARSLSLKKFYPHNRAKLDISL